MLSSEITDFIECVIPHCCPKKEDTSKKCAFCMIDYKYIAIKPIELECDHHICDECQVKAKNGSIWCKICKCHSKGLSKISKPAELLITSNLKELSQTLADKFKVALSSLKEHEVITDKNLAEMKIQLKNEIDLRIEFLKKDLDDARVDYHKEVEEYCDAQMRNINAENSKNRSFENIEHQLKDQIMQSTITKEKFYEYQKDLKEMIEKLQQSYEFKIDINFKPSSEKIQRNNLIGVLNYEKNMTKKGHNDVKQDFSVKNNEAKKRKRYIASGCGDKTIKLWDSQANNELIRTIKGHSSGVRFIKHLGKNVIASTDHDNLIKIWNIETGSCLAILKGHKGLTRSLELIDDNLLVSGCEDKTIKVWDLSTMSLSDTIENCDPVYCVKLIGKDLLASSGAKGNIKIWDLKTKVCVYELVGHKGTVWQLKIIEPNTLLSCSEDKTICVWDLENRKCLNVIDKIGFRVKCIQLVQPNIIACGCNDEVHLVDIQTGNIKSSLIGHSSHIWSLELLEPRLLASGSDDNTIKLWNLRDNSCIQTLEGHTNTIFSLADISFE